MAFRNHLTSLLIATALLCLAQVQAAIRLPALVGNNMVLQQNAAVRLWGWADAGETIAIHTGWDNLEKAVTAQPGGLWSTVVQTPAAGGPFTITISTGNTALTLSNVLTGEVWLCAGNAGMACNFGTWNKDNFKIMQDLPLVRIFTVQPQSNGSPAPDFSGSWQTADTSMGNAVCAAAWFFGSELHRKLNIPIGLIVAAGSDAPIESWIPVSEMEADPDLGSLLAGNDSNTDAKALPGQAFNTMIYPLVNYTIRGFIWYPCEAASADARLYAPLTTALIHSWRSAWTCSELPFYFVQLPRRSYEKPYTGALLREAQQRCLSISNTAMAVTGDLACSMNGSQQKNISITGNRLALCALHNSYSYKDIEFTGPLFDKMEFAGSKAFITFQHSEGLWLKPDNALLRIGGSDRIFYRARAAVKNGRLVVWSPKVRKPASVRYAFNDTAQASVFNGAGLPASPFRTDNWEIIATKPGIRLITAGNDSSLVYELFSAERESEIYYSFGKKAAMPNRRYSSPFKANTSGILRAVAVRDGFFSDQESEWKLVYHKALGAAVDYDLPYPQQNRTGTASALTDGIEGFAVSTDGAWQSIAGADVSCTVDLKKNSKSGKISCNFLADTLHCINLPASVDVSVSADGKNYRSAGTGKMRTVKAANGCSISTIRFLVKNEFRYIRMMAKNRYSDQSENKSLCGESWIFTDEIKLQ